jgi:hypothetical protein
MQTMQGVKPEGPKIQSFGGVPYIVEGGNVRLPEGYIPPAEKPTNSTPYFTPVQTANGVFAFDARTGRVAPIDVNGQPIVGSASDPALQGELAYSKESGKTKGEAVTTAQLDLPRDIQEADNTVKLIDELLAHPGMKTAVGKSSLLGVQKVPGTEARAFMVRLNQLKGKQFLQAFQSLKGGGQITEIEGQKATEAMSRMDNASTEEEFVAASREFQDIIRQGVERAKMKASGGITDAGRPKTGAVVDGYRFIGGDPADPNRWKKVK